MWKQKWTAPVVAAALILGVPAVTLAATAESAMAVDTTAPTPAPVVSTGTITSSSIVVKWTASSDDVAVTGYKVYVSKTGTADNLVADVDDAVLSYTATGLLASTQYRLKVVAYDAAGNSTGSANVYKTTAAAPTTTDTSAPTAPTVSAGTITSNSIKVNWTASTDTGGSGLAGYDVYVTKTGVTTDNLVASVGPGTLTATATGLLSSTQYRLKVVAFDGAGNRTGSANLYKTTLAGGDTSFPTAPTLSAGTATSNSVPLTWTASTDTGTGLAGYDVFQAVTGQTETKVATVGPGVTSYTASGLTSSTGYSFRVVAFDGANNRTTSNTVTKTTAAGTSQTVWAVGDLCDDTHNCAEVGNLITNDATTDKVILPGDLAYLDGTPSDFARFDADFGSQTFPDGSTIKSKSLPTPGNHEYRQTNAQPYFDYWGSIAGTYNGTNWYSVDLGNWKLISVNSNYANEPGVSNTWVQAGLTSTKYSWGLTLTQQSNQRTWLANEVAAADAAGKGVIVFDHHPALTDGSYSPGTRLGRDLFRVAATNGAELFLSGHSHNYQRFAPVDANGAASSTGTVQLVVGTGGRSPDAFTGNAAADRNNSTFGATRFDLSSTGTTWQFKDELGTVVKTGSVTIH